MKPSQFTRVGIHDPRWQIEVVEFDQNEANLTKSYPHWFIMLLVGQDPKGFQIMFHAGQRMWYLRNPYGPDYVIEEGMYVCRNNEGICWVCERFTIETDYRLFDEEFDVYVE